MSELEPTLTNSNLTVTERLRAMLDERGEVWGANDTYRLLVTSWEDASGHSWAFMEHRDGSFSKLTAYHLTPEQAIAATLGAGTCKRVMDSIDPFTMWVCDHCGHPLDTSENFCGGCGRRIEQ